MRLACPSLVSHVENGGTIVLPSPLLASIAREQVTRNRISQGFETWQRPAIYNLDAWLEACWNEARYKSTDVLVLLSRPQEQAVWQQIIEREHGGLFDSVSAARFAMQSATMIEEWHIPADGDAWHEHEDSEQFHRWYKLFRRKCSVEGWMTRAEIWRSLAKWITSGLCGKEFIVFAGFQRFHPGLERVRQALGLFAAAESAEIRRVGREATAWPCENLSQEMERAARWARASFEPNPNRSIGIFVPDLATNRALVERTFEQVFYPSSTLQFAKSRANSAFHVHASAQLIEHPLIVSALLIVELARPRMATVDAGSILRCSFVAGATAERSARALADVELRRRRDLDVSLRDIEFASKDCALLAPLWARLRRALAQRRPLLELASWSDLFSDILNALGWPGEDLMAGEEDEIVEAWQRALSRLASLGLVCGPASFDSALGHLRRLLQAPGIERGDWSSRVQILDASTAEALEFDEACIVGLGEETWPPRLANVPLVPLRLQRASRVPGTRPDEMRQERERMTAALFAAAPSTVATYSGRFSRLIEPFVSTERELLQWLGKLPRQSYVPVSVPELEDSVAPHYVSKEPARGGTAIIKAQSLCPFRAFAEFRLSAQRPEDACFGFDARERGGFLHKALQFIWAELRTSDRLRATPDHELREVVQQAVKQAVKDDQSSPFHELITLTERQRLEDVIFQWLVEIERYRKQPFTVEVLEQDRLCEISGLQLRLRVDRIDRLKNGKVLLIDYKSGDQTKNKLECPRPREPQLWVYAAAIDEEVDGVLFGEMKAREPRAVGMTREKHFDGSAVAVKKLEWDLVMEKSTGEVKRLAHDFVQGNAVVDPLFSACDYCSVSPFCRINERVRQEEEAE